MFGRITESSIDFRSLLSTGINVGNGSIVATISSHGAAGAYRSPSPLFSPLGGAGSPSPLFSPLGGAGASGKISGGIVSGEISGGIVSGEISSGIVSGEISGKVSDGVG